MFGGDLVAEPVVLALEGQGEGGVVGALGNTAEACIYPFLGDFAKLG